jgi:Aldo/keto reductase family
MLQAAALFGGNAEGQLCWQFSLTTTRHAHDVWSVQVLSDALKDAIDSGRAKAVGICNYNKSQLEDLHSRLDKHGIPLACNQVSSCVRRLRCCCMACAPGSFASY